MNKIKFNSTTVYRILFVILIIILLVVTARKIGNSIEEDRFGDNKWRRISPAEISEKHINIINDDRMAMALGNKKRVNVTSIKFGGFGFNPDGKPLVSVYAMREHFTYSMMGKSDYFTLTAFSPDYKKELLMLADDSGQDMEMIAEAGLTVNYSDIGNPWFDEGLVILECKKLFASPTYPSQRDQYGNKIFNIGKYHHTIYIGEIVNIWVRDLDGLSDL